MHGKLNALLNSGSGGWSDFKVTEISCSGSNGSKSYTTDYPAIAICNLSDDEYCRFTVTGGAALKVVQEITTNVLKELLYYNSYIAFIAKGGTATVETTHKSRTQNAIILEFV